MSKTPILIYLSYYCNIPAVYLATQEKRAYDLSKAEEYKCQVLQHQQMSDREWKLTDQLEYGAELQSI
jgi:hypothetical protein